MGPDPVWVPMLPRRPAAILTPVRAVSQRLTWCLLVLVLTAFGGRPARAEGTWVRHEVIAGDTLDSVADRYGVAKKALIRWNKKKLGTKRWIYAGQKLKVKAKVVPPPREEVVYVVQRGDTWKKIAAKYGVTEKLLRRWNAKVSRRFKAGQKLRVWTEPESIDPGETDASGPVADDELRTFSVKRGGRGVGKPNRGRLLNGVQLPESDDYTVRRPEHSWGTTHAVAQIRSALDAFRRRSKYSGRVVIGAMSREGGGRFPPHGSHQTGRDVDVFLPRHDGGGVPGSSTDVDWTATWHLVRAFLDTEQVEYIFLDYRRQAALWRAAKRLGVAEDELKRIFQYPKGRKHRRGLIRHSRGHDTHIHIRIRCGPNEARCDTY